VEEEGNALMRHSIRLGTLILAASVGVAFALQVPAVDSATRKAVVDEIAKVLNERYVSQDVAKKYGARLQAKLAAGAFDTAGTPAALASLLTQELQRVNGDKHLRVFAPGPRGAQFVPPAPKALPVPFVRELADLPHGFRRVGVLDGNIGYLDLLMFVPEATGRDTAVAAMTFLGGVDALIVDLRDNGGGSPSLIRLISSYFFDKPTHLNSIYWREGNRTEEFWTYDTVDGRRLSDVPIFVLTSRRTASGGEEFTYNLKTRRRALVIGEVTWGGANPGGTFPLPAGLRIFVPVGRAINPITGTNWEGTGVVPDVACDRERAFEIGLERARVAAKSHRRR
jgi:hypothetical protein